MQDIVHKITSLIDKHLKDELNEVERQELELWLSESDQNRQWFEQFNNQETFTQKLVEFASAAKESVWRKTVEKINADGNVIRMYPGRPVWQKYVAAAAIVIVSASAWLYFNQEKPKEAPQAQIVSNQLNNKIVPGSDKAILTLGDNSNIDLANAGNGIVAQQGNTSVSKVDGQLIYKLQNGATNQGNLYNIVTTPKGGKHKVTLPDGTKVWLNAASTLRFPIVFAGKDRSVQLTGEAYFEVVSFSSDGHKMPFKVNILSSGKESGEVEVYGTRFNIMAYDDEAAIQTTLLEGSVKVTGANANGQDKGIFIKPGEQAQLENGQIDIVKVNAAGVASWKDGTFPAENLEAILRQIARWYNVELRIEGNIPERTLEGKISRDMTFEGILKTLGTYNLHTRVEGRTLIIM